jgi:hypothetical protein
VKLKNAEEGDVPVVGGIGLENSKPPTLPQDGEGSGRDGSGALGADGEMKVKSA